MLALPLTDIEPEGVTDTLILDEGDGLGVAEDEGVIDTVPVDERLMLTVPVVLTWDVDEDAQLSLPKQ